jgi:hypothetical protein
MKNTDIHIDIVNNFTIYRQNFKKKQQIMKNIIILLATVLALSCTGKVGAKDSSSEIKTDTTNSIVIDTAFQTIVSTDSTYNNIYVIQDWFAIDLQILHLVYTDKNGDRYRVYQNEDTGELVYGRKDHKIVKIDDLIETISVNHLTIGELNDLDITLEEYQELMDIDVHSGVELIDKDIQ